MVDKRNSANNGGGHMVMKEGSLLDLFLLRDWEKLSAAFGSAAGRRAEVDDQLIFPSYADCVPPENHR